MHDPAIDAVVYTRRRCQFHIFLIFNDFRQTKEDVERGCGK